MKNRADIDGLRAIAVLPVVAYHAGMVEGGFVGVDIFFVISGYLITSILLRELQSGKFSIVDFYERRVRRLFPALFLVVGVSTIAASFLLLPEDLEEFGRSQIATALFGSNFFFWQEASYFDSAAEMKPLLHTWSLAVEEQFYILFPVFMFVCLWLGRGKMLLLQIGVTLLFLLSLLLSVWAIVNMPNAAFYLTPTRAWELMCGALLAINIVRPAKSYLVCEILSWLGLAGIFGSFFLLDDSTPFPGLTALPACLGAAMMLYANGTRSTVVGRLLSQPPLVFVGLISYSLYLWHWPILVFSRYVSIEPPSDVVLALVLGASFLAAALSWRFVEQPFRQRRGTKSRIPIFTAATSATIGCVALGAVLFLADGVESRMPQSVTSLLDPTNYSEPQVGECHMVWRRRDPNLCLRGANNTAPSFVFVGDSHAGAVAEAVFETASGTGVSGYQITNAGWLPALGIEKQGSRGMYAYMNALLEETLDNDPALEKIIIVNFWEQDVLSNRYYLENGRLVSGPEGVLNGLGALFRHYPERDFYIMHSPPSSPLFGYHTAARAQLYGRPFAPILARSAYEEQKARFSNLLATLEAHPNVTLLDPTSYLCNETSCQGQAPEGLFYRDDDHLSRLGAHQLDALFSQYWSTRP